MITTRVSLLKRVALTSLLCMTVVGTPVRGNHNAAMPINGRDDIELRVECGNFTKRIVDTECDAEAWLTTSAICPAYLVMLLKQVEKFASLSRTLPLPQTSHALAMSIAHYQALALASGGQGALPFTDRFLHDGGLELGFAHTSRETATFEVNLAIPPTGTHVHVKLRLLDGTSVTCGHNEQVMVKLLAETDPFFMALQWMSTQLTPCETRSGISTPTKWH